MGRSKATGGGYRDLLQAISLSFCQREGEQLSSLQEIEWLQDELGGIRIFWGAGDVKGGFGGCVSCEGSWEYKAEEVVTH